jgi:hypothetical protein
MNRLLAANPNSEEYVVALQEYTSNLALAFSGAERRLKKIEAVYGGKPPLD